MLMSAPSQIWEMPSFSPYWKMRIAAHGYVQWVHDGRPPTIAPDFMERIMNADMEAIAHFRYIDEMIEFEGNNPSETEMASFMKGLGYE